jgi:LDH2 family malate/lactate/ureidoglycolate dehydrogenase
VLVAADELRHFVEEAALAGGVPASQLDLFADGIVEADLRGVASHGVVRLPTYIRAFIDGVLNPAPTIDVLHSTGGVSIIDGDNGLGIVVGQLAMMHAIERARGAGIACVAVRNSNHAGMLAIHVLRAASADMIGFFTANAPALMPPWGGRSPRLGNGPLAFAVPTGSDTPVVLDMASSRVARGKIRLHAARGEPIPEGWALDRDGHDTTDAAAALDGVLLPIAEHKGYGLAFIAEILAAALSGAVFATEMPRGFLAQGSRVMDRWGCGHFAIAISLSSFTDAERVTGSIDALIASMKSSDPIGDGEIFVPGEPEARMRARQLEDGVRIDDATANLLEEFADEIGIPPLQAQCQPQATTEAEPR